MSNQRSQIQLVQSDSIILSRSLQSLQDTLMEAARQSIDAAIGDGLAEYTDLNRRAMYVTEALRLTSGLDLSTVLMRGALIKQIEDENLVGVHPNGYANLTALARDAGIASVSELSNIRDLCEVVFPFIQNILGWDLKDTWEKVGKSNFRELVPALRSMITGEDADHESVRQAVAQMLDSSAAEMIINEEATQDTLDDSEVRRNAIESLLRGSAGRTVREVRRSVRPNPVPPVHMATIRVDEQWYAVMQCETREQYDLVMRVLSAHANNQAIDPNELTPAQRRFLRSVFGGNE